jgi:hypothetical protein
MDEKLFYQPENGSTNKLIPISEYYFIVEGLNFFRIKFIVNDNSIIMKKIFNYGSEREYPKDE